MQHPLPCLSKKLYLSSAPLSKVVSALTVDFISYLGVGVAEEVLEFIQYSTTVFTVPNLHGLEFQEPILKVLTMKMKRGRNLK
jgi:hypothetical protein